MRLRLCAALLVLSAPLAAAETDTIAAARDAIDDCIRRLDREVDVGFDRIAARCPQLPRTLEQSGFAQWLPQNWNESRNNLSVGSLAELRTVVEREMQTRANAPMPRVEQLHPVLATLGEQRAHGTGAWFRFKQWLRNLIEQRGCQQGEGWFDRMVSRVGISEAIVEIVTYVALAAMVVLALIVVLNELRAAGLLGRRPRDAEGEGEHAMPGARPPPTLSEIERAPVRARPGLMLELVAAKLTAKKRLPPAGALTVNEVARAAALDHPQDRDRLALLAQASERARYAEAELPPNLLESAFAEGHALLHRVDLLGPPAPLASERA